MLKKNKYSQWYYSIIQNRKAHPLEGYTENHHIMPTALGGDNSPENRVKLSAREHWVCHQLLTRMTEGIDRMKMLHPCVLFKKTSRSSKRYQQLKEQRSAEMIGYKHRPETKIKIGNAHRGRQWSEQQLESAKLAGIKRRGFKHSEETKVQMMVSHTGTKHKEETKLKIAAGNKGKNTGKVPTLETCEKISKANKGKEKPAGFGQQIREARSYMLRILCPNQEITTIQFAKKIWAKERGLRLGTLISKFNLGTGEFYKGYKLLEIIKPS